MRSKIWVFIIIVLFILFIPSILYADSIAPDIWPTWGRVTSLFGEQRTTHIHMGLDIANDTGTFVKATMDGEVIYADYDGGFGNKVVIEQNNYKTVYAHLDKMYVDVNDKVQKGDIIATMGNTGHSTGSHLHYEVIRNNINKDPLEYLP